MQNKKQNNKIQPLLRSVTQNDGITKNPNIFEIVLTDG